MLVTTLIWILAVSAGYGYAQLFSGQRNGAVVRRPAEVLVSEIYGGLLFISALLLAISLQHRLAWWVGLLAITPGLAILLRSEAIRYWMTRGKWLLAPLPLALFVSTRDVSFYDTALYHQQAVKWLSTFGLVPGLALLHFRLGFTSSWFAFAAPMNSGMLAGRASSILGGLV